VLTAAALSLVFVPLQVGRCQIQDTSANLHVFTHPRVRVCVHASVRRYTTILHVQIGACEVDETSTSGCAADLLACRFGRQICSPATTRLVRRARPACSQVPREKSRATTSTSPEIKVCLWASVMIGCRTGWMRECPTLSYLFFPLFFSLPAAIYVRTNFALRHVRPCSDKITIN